MDIDMRDPQNVAQERLHRATSRMGTLVNRDEFLQSAARMRQGVVTQGAPAEGIRDAFNLDKARLRRGATYLGDYSTPAGAFKTAGGPYAVRGGMFQLTNEDGQVTTMIRLRSGKYVNMADMMGKADLSGIRTYDLGEGRVEDQFSLWSWAAFWAGLLGAGTIIGYGLTKGPAMKRIAQALPYAMIAPVVGAFSVHAAPRLLDLVKKPAAIPVSELPFPEAPSTAAPTVV